MSDTISDMRMDHSHPAGRFVKTPITRANLQSDLIAFLAVAIGTEGPQPSASEHKDFSDFAMSLIVNVLDAHVEAAYKKGRQDGHRDTFGPGTDQNDPNPKEQTA